MADVEAAKRAAAKTAVANHYPKDARWVGIGSGTTIVYVIEAIKALGLIVTAGLTAVEFDSLPEGIMLDVAFDGADEVDDKLNCIKGGGACLFQEKLVAMQAKEFICVAGANWKYIPIEVAPIAAFRVLRKLKELGAGPLKTDQGFFLVDAPFPPMLTKSDVQAGKVSGQDGIWEVTELSEKIKSTAGVLDVGIFSGLTGPQATAAGGVGAQGL
ncbi:Ribose-5-phosphate isomerase [Penicillium atrosanguineum]|uniref:Ribose-5-phosphate isomerase n=1 Tax=Penicillium atrosanguineum TaxID=1132637 RepID=A0A9W9PPE6_9EURO|nr:Ribose-5-phosphate isomerase [Penicillium atrosanguineum]